MHYDPDDPAIDKAERQVRATAQTAVATRLRPDHPGFWPDAEIDLRDAYLPDIRFDRISVRGFNADLAIFSGGTVFERATFRRFAVFRGATFTGRTGFDRAMFIGGAGFSGAIFKERVWFNKRKSRPR
jgi:hypothetical protein